MAFGSIHERSHRDAALHVGLFPHERSGLHHVPRVPRGSALVFPRARLYCRSSTKATEGPALARVDALIGFPYFHGMYSKASSVFGALPSLHCAYPFLLVIMGWRSFGTKLRIATVAYYGAIVFSAVYLDHHWIVDALLGPHTRWAQRS